MNFPEMQLSYKWVVDCTLFYSEHYQELLNVFLKKSHWASKYWFSHVNTSLLTSSVVMSKDFHIEIHNILLSTIFLLFILSVVIKSCYFELYYDLLFDIVGRQYKIFVCVTVMYNCRNFKKYKIPCNLVTWNKLLPRFWCFSLQSLPSVYTTKN